MAVLQLANKLNFSNQFVYEGKPPSFNSVHHDFRNGVYNSCFGQYCYFYFKPDGSCGYRFGTYYSDSAPSIGKDEFTSLIQSNLHTDETWFFGYILSSNSEQHMHNELSPVLELNWARNNSVFRVDGSSMVKGQVESFVYDLRCSVFDSVWDDWTGEDSGWFTLSNKEGSENVSQQPSDVWWNSSAGTQRINFWSESKAIVNYADESEGLGSALGVVGNALTGLTSILDHQLIGGFTIGACVAIPLCLTLVVTLIKALSK